METDQTAFAKAAQLLEDRFDALPSVARETVAEIIDLFAPGFGPVLVAEGVEPSSDFSFGFDARSPGPGPDAAATVPRRVYVVATLCSDDGSLGGFSATLDKERAAEMVLAREGCPAGTEIGDRTRQRLRDALDADAVGRHEVGDYIYGPVLLILDLDAPPQEG